MVEDLPLRLRCGLVGDDVPLFLEWGLNKAVAGDAFGFEKRALAGDAPGGVVTPFPAAELRTTGVCWGEKPETVDDVLWRTGVDGGTDELEVVLWSWLRFRCRCAIGNSGSCCFGRRLGSRKKLFVLAACAVFVRAAPRVRPVELSSDLEDSESLLPGSGRAGGVSSTRLRGVLDDFGRGRSGSSMLTDFFPFEIDPGMNDFLLSFFDSAWCAGAASVRSSSPERLMRENILDCFLGTA